MAQPILENANDILIDLNGNISYLQDTLLWEYDAADTEVTGAYIIFNDGDLQEPAIDKLLNYVDVDYEGSFILNFYLDGVLTHSTTFADVASRTTVWRDYPLIKRKAFQKLKLTLTSSTPDTKIYGIEVDFSIARRRRFY